MGCVEDSICIAKKHPAPAARTVEDNSGNILDGSG